MRRHNSRHLAAWLAIRFRLSLPSGECSTEAPRLRLARLFARRHRWYVLGRQTSEPCAVNTLPILATLFIHCGVLWTTRLWGLPVLSRMAAGVT